MDQRREWRRDDDITFTAHRGDIEGISETGIKFVKDTTSSQNGDNISKNYSFASGRNNINGSKLGRLSQSYSRSITKVPSSNSTS